MVKHNLAKRIGSILIIASSGLTSGCLTSGCFAADLELSALSLRGKALRSVKVGKPFILRVTKRGATSLQQKPEVEGLSQLIVQGFSTGSHTGQTMSGRVQEAFISYTVTADTPGTLTLGPAKLGTQQSGTVTLEVQEPEQEVTYQEPEVTFTPDKTDVYKGEKVTFTYRFAWYDPEVSSPQFEPPFTRLLRVMNFKKARQFKDTHEGKDRYTVECKGEIYPLKEGEVTIGPLRVTYMVPDNEQDIFSQFFSRPQKRVARSEPVLLTVKPLPATDTPAQAVGTFTEFTAALSSNTAPRHEAVMLVLHLVGDTDYTDLAVPTLKLPQELRSYESKRVRKQGNISWVYILQGLEEGTHTIPSQEFVYFDTKSHAYKTLKTQPLELKITPGKPAPVADEPEVEQEVTAPLEREWFSLPLWLFILLMMVPPFIVGGLLLYEYAYPYIRRFVLKRRAKSALTRALKKLETLTDYSKVYPILKKALADYYEMPQASEKELLAFLRKQELDPGIIEQVSRLLFDANKVSTFSQGEGDASLIARAKAVLSTLSKLLVVLLVIPLQGSETIDQVTSALGVLPFIVWQLGVLIGWWALWFRYKKLSSEGRFIALFVWLLIVGGWALRARIEYRPRAWVIRKALLRVGPDESYPVRGVLSEQDEVTLVKKRGPWYYVTSSKGIGWVPEELVEKKRDS